MNARIERLNELLKQSPHDGFIRFALAKEMEKLGNYDEAINGLTELLRDDAEYIGAYYHLAALLQHTGRVNEAMLVYQNGIEIATRIKDQHALGELQQAMSNLEAS